MSSKNLARVSPEAAAARASGEVPIYLTGAGGRAFGVNVPKTGAGVVPSLKQHLTELVREANRPGPGDLLVNKPVGEMLRKYKLFNVPHSYW